MANLGGLFAQKTAHPLADARELKRIITELPKDNAFKTLDEIAGWLESLQGIDDFPADRIYEAIRQLDEAAQPHLKRLSREYLNTARLNRSDEKRLWSINYGFWTLLAAAYQRCLELGGDKARAGDSLKAILPALSTRLIAALGAVLKWERFHYGPTPNAFWLRLGKALVAAELAGVATRVSNHPGGTSSPRQEYLKVLAFQAASTDSLLPLEIELSERLIAYFLPAFIFTDRAQEDSVYWVDLQLPQPPLRLALMPEMARPTQRFFKPGTANESMQAVLHALERGNDLPPDMKLGEVFSPRQLMPVLRHLAAYLAPVPPQRRHDRHRVMHRMSVLNGLVNAFVVFSGEFGGRPAGLQMESWVVENVSRGGFGALLNTIPAEWLKVGVLIAMQPEGGENWLLGIVRRYHRETADEARLGIETIARQAISVELTLRTASSYAATAGIPALLIQDAGDADTLLVLPPTTFDVHQDLEYRQGNQRFRLAPVSLVEQTADFELARYRKSVIA